MKGANDQNVCGKHFLFHDDILNTIHLNIIHCPDFITWINWHLTCKRYWNYQLNYDYVKEFVNICKVKNLKVFSEDFNSDVRKNIIMLNETCLIRQLSDHIKTRYIQSFTKHVNEIHITDISDNTYFVCCSNLIELFPQVPSKEIFNVDGSISQSAHKILINVSRTIALRYSLEIMFISKPRYVEILPVHIKFPFEKLRDSESHVGPINKEGLELYLVSQLKS